MSNAYMAAGAAIAEVIDSALDKLGLLEAKNENVLKATENGRKIFENAVISAAFWKLGIEFEDGDMVNAYTVTAAINKTLLADTDLELSNVFNIDTTRAQIEEYAIKKINEGLAGELIFKSLKKLDLKREIKRYANFLVQTELAAGGGAISDALGDSESVLRIIARYEKQRDKPPSENPEAEGNRERQATYRANHKRHWESK